jgi:hypothetical protein
MLMARAERDKAGALNATRIQNTRAIPMDCGGIQYSVELDLYLNQLFDEALDDAPASSDAPSRRTVDKK